MTNAEYKIKNVDVVSISKLKTGAMPTVKRYIHTHT